LTEERRDIGSRLENWARWSTANERRPASSPTAAFCDRLRREALGDTSKAPDERRRIDEEDALAIERAMRHLTTQHRMLLWWCYIRQAQPEVVCRKMSIAHKPATVFVNLFRQAQGAVESLLDNNLETAR
jgi:DNA-directed RNA polymerase specialized sigma24 family protein